MVLSPNTLQTFCTSKVLVSVAVGMGSVAFLVAKLLKVSYPVKDIPGIPIVALKEGATSHDKEYSADPDEFLARCEKEYGDIFQLYLFNQKPILVTGQTLIREVFMREEFNGADATDQLTGVRAYFRSMTKSNHEVDSPILHLLARDFITPYLSLYTPRIVRNMEEQLDNQLALCDDTLIKDPMKIVQQMVACAMACVFMGEEIGKKPEVIETFIQCTHDFVKVLGSGNREASFLRTLLAKAKHTYMSPMMTHIRVLVEAATPVILKRRKEESELGQDYVRPDDVLQRMLDNFDKYNLVDIEDLCGHLLILVLASVHTTADFATTVLYYLAQYPETISKLYEEMAEVLAAEAADTEERLVRESGKSMEGNDEPRVIKSGDYMSHKAMKRMVHLDSFVREVFRNRTDPTGFSHVTRRDTTLSNGVVIPKGCLVTVNLRSIYKEESLQGPEPLKFYPWRFVGKSGKDTTKVGVDFLPFSMGKHACPGRFIATQEIKTIACMMISRYSKFEMEDPSKSHAVLHSRIGEHVGMGLVLTKRQTN